MSIEQTKRLPDSGILSYEEEKETRRILAKYIGEKHNGFHEPYDLDLYFLFDHHDDGKGFSVETYKSFTSWLLMFMCKKENSIALDKKFGSKGPEIIQRLVEFFAGIEEFDKQDQMYAWLFWRDCRDGTSHIPPERLYSLWKQFVNPDQKTPGFKR